MKKPLIASAILAALLVFGALVAPNFIDWTRYRSDVADAVHTFTGRDVEIAGDLSFRFLLTPALSASDVVLANAEGGVAENMITLDSLDVQINLFSLLTGQLEVSSVVLVNPRIALERDAEGKGNWEFTAVDDAGAEDAIADSGETDEQPEETSKASRGPKLKHFAIENGTVSYRDVASGAYYEVRDITATISADSTSGPFAVDGAFIYQGVAVDLSAETGDIASEGAVPVRARLTVADQEPGLTFAGSANFNNNKAIKGRLQGGGADLGAFLDGLARLADSRFDPQLNLAQEFSVDVSIDGPLDGNNPVVEITPITVHVGGSALEGKASLALTEVPSLSIEATVNTVSLGDWIAEAPNAATTPPAGEAGPFSLPANLTASADISISAVEYLDGVARQIRFAAKLAGGVLEVEDARGLLPGGSDLVVSGKLTAQQDAPNFSGHIRAGSNNLRGLLSWLQVDTTNVPEGQLATFSLSGALTATPDILQVHSARIALDITEAEGALGMRFGARPSYDVDLALGRINLDAYLPPETDKGASVDWTTTRKDIEGALAPLADFDAKLELSAEQLTAAGANITTARLEASLDKGTLTLGRLSAASFEAVRIFVNGRVTGLGKSPGFDVAVDIESPNVQRMTRWLEMEAAIQPVIQPTALGRTSVKGTVRGNLGAVKVDLNGRGANGTFTLEGDLKGLNPAPQTVDIRLTASHPDHRDLLDRLALETDGLTIRGAPAPLSISADISGSAKDVSGKVQVQALGGTLDVEGRVQGPEKARAYDVQIGLRHGEMRRLVQAFEAGFKPAQQQLGAVDVALSFKGSSDNYTISDLDARLGPASIAGTISAAKTGDKKQRTKITGELKAGAIPLDAFMPIPDAGAAEASRDGGQRWSHQPLDLEELRAVDVDVRLSADAIGYREYAYINPTLTVKLQDGLLGIPDLEAGLFGGQAKLAMALDVTAVPVLTMQIDIQQASTADATRVTAYYAPLTGRFDMNGRLTATGNSQFDLISSLTGKVNVVTLNGEIRGVDIPRFSERLKLVRGLPDFLILIPTLGAGRTPYGVIAANMDVRDGVVTLESLDTAIDGADVTGTGNINLPQWTIGLGGNIRMTNFPEAPPVGYEVSGALDSPKKKYRTRQLRNFMLNRLANQNVEGATADGQQGQLGLQDLIGTQPPTEGTDGTAGDTTGDTTGNGTTQRATPEEELVKGLINLLGKKKTKNKDDATDPDDKDGGN